MTVSIKTPCQLSSNDESLLALTKKTTFIIGVKLADGDQARLDNLKYLLYWIELFYGNHFDTLIVEQGEKQRLPKNLFKDFHFLRHIFLYNPLLYNRGWGYNVAIKNYCQKSEVVVILDTDILPTLSFLDSIIKCHEKYNFVSPYRNIYYTNAEELSYIKKHNNFNTLTNTESLSNPVTLTGGIAIFRKSLYLSVCGYEQYIGYGGEDRALDVTILAFCSPGDIFIQDDIFPHLFHPRDKIDRSKTNEIMRHLWKSYGCKYSPNIKVREYIHSECTHKETIIILANIANKIDSFGDEQLYKSGVNVSINGASSKFFKQKPASEIILETNALIKSNRIKEAYISVIHGLSVCIDPEGIKIIKNKISYLEYCLSRSNTNNNSVEVSKYYTPKLLTNPENEFEVGDRKISQRQGSLKKRYSNHLIRSESRELEELGILAVVVNHNYNDNAEQLRENISKYFDVLLIDSGSVPAPNKSLLLNNVYYGGLLNEAYLAASTLGYKYLFFICSDVVITTENIEKLKLSLLEIDLSIIGVYSPSTEGRAHSFCRNHGALGLRASPFVEGFVFLSDIAILKEFLPSKIKYGWGLDFMKGYYCRKNRKLCVVDDRVSVYHPPETGYSNDKARKEMYDWFDKPGHSAELTQYFSYGVEPYIKYWNNKLLISVIIPCYNHGIYLTQAVMSVLHQYYNNVEIIIVDDGSSDCTKEISLGLSGRYDQVKYLYKTNGGLSSSRNAGLSIANGQYIQFLDADDFLSENKFISQLKLIEKEDADVCVSNYKCFKEETPDIYYKYSRESFIGNPLEDYITNWEKELSIPMHCFLFKKSAIDGIYFDESLPNHEDWDFHIKVAAKNPRYVHDPNSFAYYRVRSTSMSRDRDLMMAGLMMCMSNALNSSLLNGNASNLMARRLVETQAKELKSKSDQIISLKHNLKQFAHESHYVDFLFAPHSQYHLTALACIARHITRCGLRVSFLDITSVYKSNLKYEHLNGEYEVVTYNKFMEGQITPRAVCCMNDWESDFIGRIVNACKQNLIPTIAICEGVNDFHDIDTRNIFSDRIQLRNAYGRCDHVVLNGEHDFKYYKNTQQSVYAGALLRAETPLMTLAPHNVSANKVLINYNFSYGQLSNHKKAWLDECVQACKNLDIDYSISVHPLCTDDRELDLYKTGISSNLLTEDLKSHRIVISRFSGVILEALLQGCDVVYYNPGIENIDKFNDPMGAFLKATCQSELMENILLISTKKWQPNPENFLRFHAGYGLDAHATIADILIKIYSTRSVSEVTPGQFFKTLNNIAASYIDERSHINNNKYFDYTLSATDVFAITLNKNLSFFTNKIVMQEQLIFKVVSNNGFYYKQIISPDDFSSIAATKKSPYYIYLTNYNFSGLKSVHGSTDAGHSPLRIEGNILYINEITNDNILKSTLLALKPFLAFSHYNLTICFGPLVGPDVKSQIIKTSLLESIDNVIIIDSCRSVTNSLESRSRYHSQVLHSLNMDSNGNINLLYFDRLSFPLTEPFATILDNLSDENGFARDNLKFKIYPIFDTPNNGLCWANDQEIGQALLFTRKALLTSSDPNGVFSSETKVEFRDCDGVYFITLEDYRDILKSRNGIAYKISFNPFLPINHLMKLKTNSPLDINNL